MSEILVPKQYEHRFKLGQSGNPKGKPRGPNYATKFMGSVKRASPKPSSRAVVTKARSGSVRRGRIDPIAPYAGARRP
jgi:hypothetical protein